MKSTPPRSPRTPMTPKPRDYAREEDVPKKKDNELSEFAKTAIFAILLAVFIRTFFYEPFNIPSGSMLPTLKVGDYLFVSKPAYGYSRHSFPMSFANIEGRLMEAPPKRGDPVVFKLPSNPSVDYIKRVIGLPGDSIQVIQGRLYLNGERVEREPVGFATSRDNVMFADKRLAEYVETLPDGTQYHIYEEGDNEALDNTARFVVPPRHIFVMGDNRDNSQDSRVQSLVGYVPFENLVGRADILFFSIDKETVSLNPISWFQSIRGDRILKKLDPARPEADEFAPSL